MAYRDSIFWSMQSTLQQNLGDLVDVLVFALIYEDEELQEERPILKQALLRGDNDLPILKDLLFNDIELDFGNFRLWLRGRALIKGEP